jgi:hypothetical protein
MRAINIHSHKGGVGVTTTACALAVTLSQQGERVLLVDYNEMSNIYATLGSMHYDEGVLSDALTNYELFGLHFSPSRHFVTGAYDSRFLNSNYDTVVVDSGRSMPVSEISFLGSGVKVNNICVVRNDYLTLQNTVKSDFAQKDNYSNYVLFTHSVNAPLTVKDVEMVLKAKALAVSPLTDKAQRAIDAGLLTTRLSEFKFAAEVVEALSKEGVSK